MLRSFEFPKKGVEECGTCLVCLFESASHHVSSPLAAVHLGRRQKKAMKFFGAEAVSPKTL
jgi:hypothetical protein